MAQRIQMSAPVSTGLPTGSPYGNPVAYYEASAFAECETQQRLMERDLQRRKRGGDAEEDLETIDDRSSTLAMQNPDVAAAFRAAGEEERVAGVPLDPSRHRQRNRHRQRLVDSGRDGEDDVVRAVELDEPPSPTNHGSSSRQSSRSSSTKRSHRTEGKGAAPSVSAELARRREEEHDRDCICALCEERRRQAEEKKRSGKLQGRLAEETACTNAAVCALM